MKAEPPSRLIEAADSLRRSLTDPGIRSLLHRPLIIVSAPRAGSNLLFENLARVPGFWSIGGESHGIFRAFPDLRAGNAALDSGRLDASHADDITRRRLRAAFLALLRDHRGRPYLDFPLNERPQQVTLLEKTPRNALNLPFLRRVFPHARYVYLHRDPRQNVASIAEAWATGLATGRFVTFRDLPGWDRAAWCFLLPPGWRAMIGRSLVEIAAFQWRVSNEMLLDDLGALDDGDWTAVSYRELVASPAAVLGKICRFAGIDAVDQALPGGRLALSRTTLSPPDADKWRRHETELEPLYPELDAVLRRIEATVSGG